MLKKLPQYSNHRIVRTREPSILATCDIVVDVGSEFDPPNRKFDHHQAGFTEVFGRGFDRIKLSSAGLVYKYYGHQLISELTSIIDEPTVEVLWTRMYSDMIQAIDGVDNGQKPYDTDARELYKDSTSLSSRVSRLNPSWADKDADENERFERAMKICGEDFEDILSNIVRTWLPARAEVVTAYLERETHHYSGQILVLQRSVPWKEHLFSVEKQFNTPNEKKAIYVLYPDNSDGWRVQSVPNGKQVFASRLNLPESMRGLRDEVLAGVTGVTDAIFVHATGFIGGAKSFAGALRLAELGLQHIANADI
mmetsp:Transcript_14227/g.26843  ORF Transcript_14227/g.26843 Transcript_14227/m.26843 type:complete len:309 (+) Transcript_14227:104-1030(+)